jgi:long-chain fatty acid transport protein
MDELSIGVGFQYNFGMVTLKRALAFPPFAGEAMVNLEGDDMSAFGYTAGLLITPVKELSLGLSYHSQVEYNFEGTATTENGPAALASSLPKGAIKATLKSPQQFTAGIAYTVCPEWTITADYQYIAWSSYDSLKVEFVDSKTSSSAPREYENTFILRFGTLYKACSSLDLMAGFLFDNNPVSDERVDPSLPDSDRLGFSVGASYHLTESLSLDASYLYLRFAERTVTTSLVNYTPSGVSPLNGTYNSSANLFSFSLLYSF